MRRVGPALALLAATAWLPFAGPSLAAQVPQPFPRPQSPSRPAPAPPATATPAPPAASQGSATEGAPTEAFLGFPIYPAAQFIASYDAGRGQRYYLFGSDSAFPILVKYYQSVLKSRGTLVFEEPPVHVFEIGRFREETMAFPPGVTIKDFESDLSPGYPNRPGGQPERFPSIIQIVPVVPER